jgi:hypothetical protein
MAERSPDQFVKRGATFADNATKLYSSGVGLATCHWLIKCLATGVWVYVKPDDALEELWFFTIILPPVHFIIKVVRFYTDRWAKAQGIDTTDNSSQTQA